MKPQRHPFLASLLIALTTAATTQAQTPPVAPVRPVVDDYFGTKVTDPYRWMEDMKNPELLTWMKAQADYSRSVLDAIPGRQKLLDQHIELDATTTEKVGNVDRRPGDQYFYLKQRASEPTPKLYVRQGLTGAEKLLADAEQQKGAATGHASISYYNVSQDGRQVAVGVAVGGSENTVIHILDTATGKESGETIDRATFGNVNWLPDGRSFTYVRMQKLAADAPVTEKRQKFRIYRHVVGTDAEQDKAVFGYDVSARAPVVALDKVHLLVTPGSAHAIGVIMPADRWLVLYAAPVTTLSGPDIPWRKVCDLADSVSDVALHGDDLYVVSGRNASHYKVLRTSLKNPDLTKAEVIVPAGEAVVSGYASGMGALHAAQDALYVQLQDGGLSRLLRVSYGARPTVSPVKLPFAGNINEVETYPLVPGLVVSLNSWVKSLALYAYDPGTGQTTDTKLQPLGSLGDASAYLEAEEVKVKAADGTLIPLSIIHKRGLVRNGNNPTLFTGYGSYGAIQKPMYDPAMRVWYDQGGIYAIAHVRGGGEYGEDWHRAGQKATKPNTWRDFNACAEYLIQQKYTSPAKLAGWGTSAGGILIGRAVTERPDLYGVAIMSVGCLDMLRFETTANGVPNVAEFGSTKTEAGFNALYEMSAFHHVKDGTKYPATLIITGINDPRVEPWLSAKMAARLQAASVSGKPVLLRVDYDAGHGVGSTTRQFYEMVTDVIAFMHWQFGEPDAQPTGGAQASKK